VLSGENESPVNNLLVVSNVAKTYAPARQALISVSVVGKPESRQVDLEISVRRQLFEWYGSQLKSWSPLRRYDIPFVLTSQPAHFRDVPPVPGRLFEDVYQFGGYPDTASMQGVMMSGRRTAEAKVDDFSVRR
jgi:hypothetical protein